VKRRVVVSRPSRHLDVPECLRAGRCLEVWSPEELDVLAAWRAWGRAKTRWLELNGLAPRDHASHPSCLRPSGPWSFAFCERTNPEYLADRLARDGLPADWRPTPAPPEWLDIPACTPARKAWED